MKKIILTLIIPVIALAIGVFAGQLFSKPAVFNIKQTSGNNSTLDNAWDNFIRAQQEALTLVQAQPFYQDSQSKAEGYRALLYAIVGSIKSGALMEHEYPRFMRAVDWSSKSGLDNPDNNYYIALIDDDSDYKIIGTRGSTIGLVFQLVVGQPGVKGAGSSTNVSVLDSQDMIISPNGNFEIIVSRNNPGKGVNWLPNAEGAETILARYTHNNWQTERAGELLIEKLGPRTSQKPALTEAMLAEKLNNTAISLFDRTATWLGFSNKLWKFSPQNSISESRESTGGLPGQYSAFGSWELGGDEALILTTHPVGAAYQGIELGSRWFVSLEYEHRTSTLTPAQSYQSSDGLYHYIISANDPGVQNWLDTEGHKTGLIMMRWQGLKNELPKHAQPSIRRVKFDRIRDLLPADVPVFTKNERQEQIRVRSRSVQARFRG